MASGPASRTGCGPAVLFSVRFFCLNPDKAECRRKSMVLSSRVRWSVVCMARQNIPEKDEGDDQTKADQKHQKCKHRWWADGFPLGCLGWTFLAIRRRGGRRWPVGILWGRCIGHIMLLSCVAGTDAPPFCCVKYL